MENTPKKAPLSELMETTMNKIHEMVDSNAIIGEPINTMDGVTLIPVSHLSFGFATGGSDFGKTPNVSKNFGGGAGAGVNVTPVAFLIVKDGSVRILPVAPPAKDTGGRVVELIPEMFDKVTACSFVKRVRPLMHTFFVRNLL